MSAPKNTAGQGGATGDDRVLIVSGLSGAGKSSAMKALEDLGYDAVDNLPLGMIAELVADWPHVPRGTSGRPHGLAIGVDSRTRDFGPERLSEVLNVLRQRRGIAVELLFLDCDDALLFRRFTETRRRHPMTPAGERLRDAVAAERATLEQLRSRAGLVLDTTDLSTRDLRHLIAGSYALAVQPELIVSVISFSYRRGLPREADLVFDMRFLANPHYVEELRPGTGRDPEVGKFIAADPYYQPTLEKVADLIHGLMDGYRREGKSYLTVAVGCTGGRHRSVFFSEQLAKFLRDLDHRADVSHRDLEREIT